MLKRVRIAVGSHLRTLFREILPFPQAQRPPARRGRAPANVPDPWSDLEWEEHREAREAVRRNPHGMTLEEIAAMMGVTRERIRQIETTALTKLRDATGGDISFLGRLTMSTPDCQRCGEAYVRVTGRQRLCEACESKRKKRGRVEPLQIPAAPRRAATAA